VVHELGQACGVEVTVLEALAREGALLRKAGAAGADGAGYTADLK
jgi:hypothetical protein